MLREDVTSRVFAAAVDYYHHTNRMPKKAFVDLTVNDINYRDYINVPIPADDPIWLEEGELPAIDETYTRASLEIVNMPLGPNHVIVGNEDDAELDAIEICEQRLALTIQNLHSRKSAIIRDNPHVGFHHLGTDHTRMVRMGSLPESIKGWPSLPPLSIRKYEYEHASRCDSIWVTKPTLNYAENQIRRFRQEIMGKDRQLVGAQIQPITFSSKIIETTELPKNNQGLSKCCVCNTPTVKRGGGMYDCCPNDECVYFDK